MAAFIVISTDEHLHYLVDGIVKCRPSNNAVETFISTGKIIQKESGDYLYNYTVSGGDCKQSKAKCFGELLSNQLAQLIKVCGIQNGQCVNIFFLENPLDETKNDSIKEWLKGFDEICQKGKNTNFRLIRVLFTYNLENPTDVCNQKHTNEILKSILDLHKEKVESLRKGGNTYQEFIFYIDNQDANHGALCLNKNEHDLKMPRFLADFMMLISNSQDSYGVLNAINNNNNTCCFSVGFAESMYYYPDVERYFVKACKETLYDKCLNSDDTCDVRSDNEDIQMSIPKYPLGLNKRRERLGKRYGDVSFDDDIAGYSESADKEIADNLSLLKELLVAKRKEEEDAFNKKKEKIAKKIQDCQDSLDNLSDADSDEKKNELLSKKKQLESELQQMSFHPICPKYLDRATIRKSLHIGNGSKKDLAKQYDDLLNYVCSKGFSDYAKKYKEKAPTDNGGDPTPPQTQQQERQGCCLRWLSFLHLKFGTPEQIEDKNLTKEDPKVDEGVDYQTTIDKIKEMITLKKCYVRFCNEVRNIENEHNVVKSECKNFTLTEHSNSFMPLIDLGKLRDVQKEIFNEDFFNDFFGHNKDKSITELIEKLKIEVQKVTKNYKYIDWNEPFPFVLDLSKDKMANICEQLWKRSAPFVNYDVTTMVKVAKEICCLYSDRPNIKDEFGEIKNNMTMGNAVSPYCSSHIVSKLCFFQFLPLSDGILQNLADLQDALDYEE